MHLHSCPFKPTDLKKCPLCDTDMFHFLHTLSIHNHMSELATLLLRYWDRELCRWDGGILVCASSDRTL